VYVFIQGGGFNENSGTSNGRTLLKASGMSIVIVTFNYRVGPFGFLASTEVQDNGSLNNGLKDQRQMLYWIQDHIRQFGGNPEHVVMGGASAGGAAVTLQLIAYGGRDEGLFHATAAQSQSFAAMRTVSESQYQYDRLVARTGCNAQETGNNDTLACLRGLDINKLDKYNIKTEFPGATQAPLFAYNPTLDYDFIEDYPLNMFESGHFVRVPAIYGWATMQRWLCNIC
jgi:cholinesterase